MQTVTRGHELRNGRYHFINPCIFNVKKHKFEIKNSKMTRGQGGQEWRPGNFVWLIQNLHFRNFYRCHYADRLAFSVYHEVAQAQQTARESGVWIAPPPQAKIKLAATKLWVFVSALINYKVKFSTFKCLFFSMISYGIPAGCPDGGRRSSRHCVKRTILCRLPFGFSGDFSIF